MVSVSIFVWNEGTPQNRSDSQQRKHGMGNQGRIDAQGLSLIGEVEVARFECAHLSKCSASALVVPGFLNCDTKFVLPLTRFNLCYQHQAGGISIRKRMKQYGIEQAEHRGICAYSKRKSEQYG